jgi:stearoyl-CoA desaturase (delta-9 desaturase)
MSVSVSGESALQPEVAPAQYCWLHITFFGVFHLIALISGIYFFSWSALGIAVLLHWMFGSLGICLGYHRLLSHRSFQVPKPVEYFFATLGALALQGGPIFWCGGHRQHHAFTEDVNKDPYSIKRGFWWSHILWILAPRDEFFQRSRYDALAPDLSRDAYYQFLDRYFILLQIPLGGLLYLLGGWPFVFYGIFVRAVLLWHSTWFVNSASHYWGNRPYDSDDNARNLWWVALLTYGEGWHNNHHADPKCARAGLHWWQIDMTYWAIALMQRLGMARKVHQSAL